MKYYDKPEAAISKAAFTFTFDAGCEYGGGVSCGGGTADAPSQTFLGFMAYHRAWFDKDRFALTVGGGAINNPGRYLVLIPPINGATAFSGTPYFTYKPRRPVQGVGHAGDVRLHAEPVHHVPLRIQLPARQRAVFLRRRRRDPARREHRAPGSFVAGWAPDLRPSEKRVTFAMLVKL